MSLCFECAPMEGVTDYIFRLVQSDFFCPADRYYTPFLSLTRGHGFQKKEYHEMLPEHNLGLNVIPQIIGNDINDLLWGIQELQELGYKEINLNTGCPSKVVVRKGKGAGMLGNLPMLERFLDMIFMKADCKISVKTRIGLHDAGEFPEILRVYNRFPLCRLIIHGRVSDQGYKGSVNLSAWEYACHNTEIPLCYNGDLFNAAQAQSCLKRNHSLCYPCSGIMFGRGLIANPALIGELKGYPPLDAETFAAFQDALYEKEAQHIINRKHLLIRMKSFWAYWGYAFTEPETVLKKILRTADIKEYLNCKEEIFRNHQITKSAGYNRS